MNEKEQENYFYTVFWAHVTIQSAGSLKEQLCIHKSA